MIFSLGTICTFFRLLFPPVILHFPLDISPLIHFISSLGTVFTFYFAPWLLCLLFLPVILYFLSSQLIFLLTHFPPFSTICTFYFSSSTFFPHQLLCFFSAAILYFSLHILISPSCMLFSLSTIRTFVLHFHRYISSLTFVPFFFSRILYCFPSHCLCPSHILLSPPALAAPFVFRDPQCSFFAVCAFFIHPSNQINSPFTLYSHPHASYVLLEH